MEIALWIIAVLACLFGFVVFFGAPYLPSKRRDIMRAFDELYTLSSQDVVLDLGSGDGVVLREVSRRGARAIGYELNPLLVFITRWLSRGDVRVKAVTANFMHRPFPDETTLVYMFGNSRDNKRFVHMIKCEATRLERPLYLMSYAFTLEGLTLVKKNDLHNLYLVEPLQRKKPQV